MKKLWVSLGLLCLLNNSYAVDLHMLKTSQWQNPIPAAKKPYSDVNQAYWKSKLARDRNAFCGVDFSKDHSSYQLQTFPSRAQLLANGYQITHKGACGVCSSLQDLAVYLEKPNLTKPVRQCGLLAWLPFAAKNCLKRIGFSDACAQIWYDNTVNTAKACGTICIKSWLKHEPFNLPDGSLNACLACDEAKSGPVFKAVAGRTRRNSGIISAIKRPGEQVYPVDHNYR